MGLFSCVRKTVSGFLTKYVTAEISYLQPDSRLEGKNILITGGSRGIGYAMAEKFIAEGAQVVITGRNSATLQTAAESLGCRYVLCDQTHVSCFVNILSDAESLIGTIDTLVNNAGVSMHEGDITKVTEEQYDQQLDTNLKGTYFLTQQFIDYVESKGLANASILFITSERGEYVDDLPYGLTKTALNSLVKGLAKRLISRGIRVNAVAPGVTASDMTGISKDGNLYVDYNMTERVYLPEEVAEIACFLLSDASRCLSGQILVCNEGKSINAHWK